MRRTHLCTYRVPLNVRTCRVRRAGIKTIYPIWPKKTHIVHTSRRMTSSGSSPYMQLSTGMYQNAILRRRDHVVKESCPYRTVWLLTASNMTRAALDCVAN